MNAFRAAVDPFFYFNSMAKCSLLQRHLLGGSISSLIHSWPAVSDLWNLIDTSLLSSVKYERRW